ncbi:MAG TPA: tetratricopeptide repeat protein [Polyangiaceae bacterium]|jgi:tetratricopeptide (TPR) repeat protein
MPANELLRPPAGVPPLVHRANMTREHGAYAFDFFRSAWWCHRCRAHVASGPPAAVIALVTYADVDSFVSSVETAARQAVADADAAPTCETCGDRAAIDHLDYHAYCSEKRADLVARFRTTQPVDLLWWTHEGGFSPATVDDATRAAFARDALLRGARAARETDDVDRACEALRAASKAIPGEPELLGFMPWLCARKKTDVAGAVAEAHTRVRPHDPEGWYWLAQIGVEIVASGTFGPELLPQVEQHLQRALAIAPTHAQALVAVANVARIRGDLPTAVKTLERLLAMHPGHPEGSYTLGLMLIDRDPARALACFEAGEQAQPKDPDYPRGRARALLALGRFEDAKAAAERAHALAPDDPRVVEMMARFTN